MTDADASRAAGERLRIEIEKHLGPSRPIKSLRQLALASGVGATTISQWWTKGIAPDTASLDKVAVALGTDLSVLFDAYSGRTTVREPVRVSLTLEEIQEMMNRAAERAVERLGEDLKRAFRDE